MDAVVVSSWDILLEKLVDDAFVFVEVLRGGLEVEGLEMEKEASQKCADDGIGKLGGVYSGD